MENMIKRFLSMALAVLMVFSMLPTNIAFAAETGDDPTVTDSSETPTEDPTEEPSEEEPSEEPSEPTAELSEGAADDVIDTEDELIAAFEKGGEIQLGGNIENVAAITVQVDTVLDLNGHTLSFTSDGFSLCSNLTIEDSGSDGELAANNQLIRVEGDGRTLTITGGTFKTPANAKLDVSAYVAEGYVQDDNGTVVPAASYVAQIGDVKYESLQAAIDAASAGSEVELIADVILTEGITVAADDVITLDLNGKTISQTYAQTAGYQMILNDGNLTINDSVGGGKISYTDSGNGGEYISDTIYNRGTLVINGGTIENLSSATVASNGYPHAVDNYSGIRNTALTVNGGTIYCAEYSAIRMFCVSATNKADLVITGGTIKGAVDMQNGTKDAALGSLTITGGTFETTKNANNIRFANWNGGATAYGISASIKGGSFNGGVSTSYVPAAANWNSKIITGGTFASDMSAFCAEGYACVQGANGTYGVAERTLKGEGTKESPYLINNLDDLKLFRNLVNGGNTYEGKYVNLTADIDLTGEIWIPIGTSNYDKAPTTDGVKMFAGNFDGGDHTITGLSSDGYVPDSAETGSTEYSFGLFGYVYGANISNVKLANVDIDCGTRTDSAGNEVYGSGVAALIGYYFPANEKTVVIEDCHVLSGTVKASNNMGGLIGHLDSQTSQPKVDITIKNCSNAAAVTTEAREAGGILGLMNSARKGNYLVTMSGTVTFENCTNTGAITSLGGGAPSAGGILGRDHNQAAGQRLKIVFDGCKNSGTITVTANGETHAAGIGAGYYSAGAWLIAKNCSNTGNVVVTGTSSDVYAGGLISYGGVVELIDSTSTGKVTIDGTAGNTYVGGAQSILFLEGMDDYKDTVNGNTYWLNGGTSPEYAALVDDAAGGGNFHLVETAYKEGSVFGGWYDNPEFTGEAYTALSKNVKTYYAKWTFTATEIKIYDWEDLKALDKLVESGEMLEGVTVKLMNDIDLYEMGADGEPVSFDPIGANAAYFKGTFDGQGHTIKNMYQSGWALGYDWYNYGTIGLFAYLWDATVKNLTIENAECFVEGGNVAGIAGCAWGNCTFENITIKNSTYATYNNRAAGIVGYTGGEGTMTFKGIAVDQDTVIAALWGSYDCTLGGVVGSTHNSNVTKYVFEDVDVACRLDCYNDVTASYKWYSYRMCGMLIGSMKALQAGTTDVDPRGVVTINNVDITIGEWANYTYIHDDSLSKGCQRVESGYTYDGVDVANYPDTKVETIGFSTIIGGPQSQSSGYYGSDVTKLKALEDFDTITLRVNDIALEIRTTVAKIGDVKYTSLADALADTKDNDTVVILKSTDETIGVPAGNNVTITAAEGVELSGGVGGSYYNKSITLDGLNFVGGKGIALTAGVDGLTYAVKNCTFDGVQATAWKQGVISLNGKAAVVVENNTITNVKNATEGDGRIESQGQQSTGVYISGATNVTVSGNTISGVDGTGINVACTGTMTITDNTISAWGTGATAKNEGRAIRTSGGTTVTITGNVMSDNGTAKESYIKATDAPTLDVSKNYWNGNHPLDGNYFESDNGVDAFAVLQNYYADGAKTELIELVAVAQVGDTKYETLAEAIAAAKASENKTITLLVPMVLTENTTLDLTGLTVDGNGVYPAFRIQNGANVTVKGGTVTNSDYVFVLGASDGSSAGNLTIESGEYHGETTVASVTKGTLTITGGEFAISEDEANDYAYLLNCIDANYKDGSAKIVVKGGTFENFNPENNAAEGAGTNFMPEGYKANAASDSDVTKYTVVEANVVMDGVYYATIKDALWTLKSADTTVHTVKVLKDHEIDVNYSTYNYPILVNGFAIELDLNGKTLTADWSKYTGSRKDNALIGVCNGGKLTVTDSVGGGKIVNNDDKADVENRIFWIMTSTATKSLEVTIEGGTFIQNDTNTALLYVQGNKPSDNLASMKVTIEGGHFETVNDDFFNAYDNYQHESYIVGGTFNKNPSDWEIKIHPDYKVVEHEVDGVKVYGVAPGNFVAEVGETRYESLAEAIAAANAVEGGATVELLKDITLSEKLTVTGNVTISGEKTITRADSYTGTLFAVNAGATLTLDGGLVIDGANNWSLNTELYNKALNREVTGVTWAELITSEENAPNAVAAMFVVNGAVVANNVTIQNNYSTKDSNGGDGGVFKVEANATLTMTGAKIDHIVTGGANSVAHLSTNSVWTINDGTLITDTFAGKNGGVCRNDSGKLIMNGGEISNNNSINTNGTVVMLYKGSMEMNGGKICSNTGISGTANGRCAPIYGHSTSTFVMTGGEICHNTGISYGGVDVPSSIKVEISGGYIGDNISAIGNTNADVNGNANTVISGGTFKQDVSQWLAPDCGLVYDEETGIYSLTKDLYEYNGAKYQTLAKVIEAIKNGGVATASTEAPVVTVLENHKVDGPVAIDTDLTLDLNGKTITTAATAAGTYVDAFTILANVTVTGEGTVDARPSHGYTFYVGDQSGNAGTLTIENGTFYGETSVVNNRLGTVTINGGNFAISLENEGDTYAYLLNCIDDNYKDGSAKIEITGGTFHNWNPEDNAAENPKANFCADGYLAETKDGGATYTVRKANYVAQVGENKYESLAEAIDAAKETEDKVVTILQTIALTEDGTLDLQGVCLNAAADLTNTPVIRVLANITVTNGIIDGGSGINSYAFIVGNNETTGTLNIADGTYCGVTSAISITNGTVNISGGTFQTKHDNEGTDYGTTYLLNCMDAAYNNGTAKYNITGGKFVGFNPENNAAEGEGTNFCAEGYLATNIGNDTWTVGEAFAYNTVTKKYFATVSEGLEEAAAGQTVIVLKDTADSLVFVTEEVTLDLNGKTLEATYVTCFGDLVDNSDANSGYLKVSEKHIMLRSDNAQIPVNTENGYQFIEIKGYNILWVENESKLHFQPLFEPYAHELLEKGVDITDVTINVRVSWTQSNGTRYQDFVYSDAQVTEFVSNYVEETGKYDKDFTLKVNGMVSFEDLTFTAVVSTAVGVESESNPVAINP